jgi:hypothetical protein
MTAAPLATTDDLEARLGRDLTTSEAARAPALLADAGAKVRSFTGNQFALVEEDLVNLHTRGGRIRLPKAPVVAVTSVATTDGVALATNLWTWDGVDLITVDQCALAPVMQVVYSHGSADVPETVLAKVCEMVLRVLAAPPPTASRPRRSGSTRIRPLGALRGSLCASRTATARISGKRATGRQRPGRSR